MGVENADFLGETLVNLPGSNDLRAKSCHPTSLCLIVVLTLVGVCGGCKRSDKSAVDKRNEDNRSERAGGELARTRSLTVAAGKVASTRVVFTEVTMAAGINHRHHKPVLDHQLDNIMAWVSSVGAAAAAGDYDNDGWLDLYVTDSRKGYPNFLYHNNADGTFTDVAGPAGVAELNGEFGTSMDCVWGDYDNDGWIDLYLVRWGTDVLFRNNGDGTFSDVTARCFRRRDGSSGTQWANGNAAIWFDYNLDGRLDLYVGNYFQEIDLWHLKDTRIMHNDFETARNGGVNFLYRQNEDGTFTEVAVELGVDDPGWTLAVGAADVNNDGFTDLYCADDFGPDQLFLNDRSPGSPAFVNVSEAALGFDSKKGMNVDFGDFNNDGWLDIYVTNITTAEYLQEGNMLWYNNGPDAEGMVSFIDISLETGTYDGGWGWGAKFLDFDNDGDLDIAALNGFITAGEGNYWYDLASWSVLGQDPAEALNWPTIGNRSFSGHERIRFWRNDGIDSFTEHAEQLGLHSRWDGRGLVCFDYDNDGDLDLFIANQDQPPHLYRNDPVGGNHWLMVALQGSPPPLKRWATPATNRDAVGARVTVVTARGRQIRERDGGNGYCGQSDPRLHFGLGPEERVKLLEVRWPDGGLQYLEDVPADQLITVRQDPDRYASRVALTVDAPRRRPRENEQRPAAPKMDPAALERLLVHMEGRIREDSDDYTPASAYRLQCAAHDQHDRSIRFFEKRVEAKPDDMRRRIELACANIDKIPTCGGIAAIVSKGTLARKALDQQDHVIEVNDASWVAYYTRGMNHLHWPRALRHSDDAVVDLKRCIQLQVESGDPGGKQYYVRTHIALGDAHTKEKKYEPARAAWRKGLKLFPNSTELQERLAIADNGDLLDYVEDHRSLERPIDTDLSFLDR